MKITIKDGNNNDITQNFTHYLKVLEDSQMAIYIKDILPNNDQIPFKVFNIIVNPFFGNVTIYVSIQPL